MANMLFANNCNTTLNGGISAIATSMVVASATGFPTPTGSQYFYCTLADAATQTTIEIVKVTAVSGTTFTIVRGQDGTTGTIFASGAVVSLRLVAASLNDFPKLDEANTFTFAPTFNTALGVASGGTGLTSLTAGYIPYGNGTSALSSAAGLAFDGTSLSIYNGAATQLNLGYSSTYRWNISRDNVTTSNLVISSNNGSGLTSIATFTNAGNLQFNVSNGGVIFNNSSALTNSTLNDYEVGTFTPVLAFGGGSTGIVYTNRSGNYTKVGNVVTVSIGIYLSSKGSSTGNATITGLPFTSLNAAFIASSGLIVGSINFLATTFPLYGVVGGAVTSISLQSSATGSTNLTDTNFSNFMYFSISLTYLASF